MTDAPLSEDLVALRESYLAVIKMLLEKRALIDLSIRVLEENIPTLPPGPDRRSADCGRENGQPYDA